MVSSALDTLTADIMQEFETNVVTIKCRDEKYLTNLEQNALVRLKVDVTSALTTDEAEDSFVETKSHEWQIMCVINL